MQLIPEVLGLAAMESSGQEESDHGRMPHLQKTSVCPVYSAANYAKPAALDLPGQLAILSKEGLFIKAGDLVKPVLINEHEHSSRKRPVETGETLHYVVAAIQQVIQPDTIPAQDIRCYTMQRLSFDQVDSASAPSSDA